MAMNITCPYCFEEFEDDQVHFRSELVNRGELDIIPDEYDDYEDFVMRYKGADKESILAQYRDWDFFRETEDPQYNSFWKQFGGTTENDPLDETLRFKAYHRRVIDPSDKNHRRYLKAQPDGSFFHRNGDGMVDAIQLTSGEICTRRVCPFCHNPLPQGYGKNPVKFIPVVGCCGSGKTVYLSQLLKYLSTYTAKVGLSCMDSSSNGLSFLKMNPVSEQVLLPRSTVNTFQQPLCYELSNRVDGQIVTDTLVLYDMSGELFNGDMLRNIAPVISHASGILCLLDPEQLSDTSHRANPYTVVQSICSILNQGSSNKRVQIPVAVCISKADQAGVQDMFSASLLSALNTPVQSVSLSNGTPDTCFNAEQYAPIAAELQEFFRTRQLALDSALQINCADYAYFIFSALGCGVNEQGQPIGPIQPKRIEEPLLWLFYRFGWLTKNAPIPGEAVTCPACHSCDTMELPEEEQTLTVKGGFLGLGHRTVHVSHVCCSCGNQWDNSSNS